MGSLLFMCTEIHNSTFYRIYFLGNSSRMKKTSRFGYIHHAIIKVYYVMQTYERSKVESVTQFTVRAIMTPTITT